MVPDTFFPNVHFVFENIHNRPVLAEVVLFDSFETALVKLESFNRAHIYNLLYFVCRPFAFSIGYFSPFFLSFL